MTDVHNYGLILRLLRKRRGLGVQKAAELFGKSIGWLSEVENSAGTSKLSQKEFDRIVGLLNADAERSQFKTWIATEKNLERSNQIFDGAVLKFIRLKAGLTQKEACTRLGFSISHLSRLENGRIPISLELRNQMMKAYGYNPSSFKNFSTDPVRAKAVPKQLKIMILVRKMNDDQLSRVLEFALAEILGRKDQQK